MRCEHCDRPKEEHVKVLTGKRYIPDLGSIDTSALVCPMNIFRERVEPPVPLISEPRRYLGPQSHGKKN